MSVLTSIPKHLLAAVAEIPEFEQIDSFSPLGGGITNKNYLVKTPLGEFVLRSASEATCELGIDRGHEFDCAKKAADLGLGPKVIRRLKHHNVLVTRFIHAKPLTPKEITDSQIVSCARIIKTYHAGPKFLGVFSPFEVVSSYHQKCMSLGVQFPKDIDEALNILKRVEKLVSNGRELVPCHNDLLAENFLDGSEKIWLIDWEYAAMGDPMFDLANFATNFGLSDAQSLILMKSYFDDFNDATFATMRVMGLASVMREAFWGFLQSAISPIEFDYLAYANKNLTQVNESAPKIFSSFESALVS